MESLRTWDLTSLCSASSGPGCLKETGRRCCSRHCCATPRSEGGGTARGRQRTDSTHVLAAIQTLSRLECVAETLRHALNVLAATIPDWVQDHVPAEWYERYGTRWQEYRLPSGRQERQDLAEMIGQDGRQLFALLEQTPALTQDPGICRQSRLSGASGSSNVTRMGHRQAFARPPICRPPVCSFARLMTPRRASARSVRPLGRATKCI
jgi:hypothetical protein